MDRNEIIDKALELQGFNFKFNTKPLIIGGLAMEYYGLRKRGQDIDLIITNDDYKDLSKKYPNNKKDIWGDLGVVINGFEIWRSIALLDYYFYAEGSIEYSDYKVVSFDRLFFMRALALGVEKYKNDFELMKQHLLKRQPIDFIEYQNKHIEKYKSVPGGIIFNDEY
ncbi:MAG TPA: hypothetical protein PK624_03565 [Spirochaetota bacterium]|nr:hypothetical protein [Spirochaetota bacterium]HPK55968.1 hypothetical protein [Spirochaetota bacterium]